MSKNISEPYFYSILNIFIFPFFSNTKNNFKKVELKNKISGLPYQVYFPIETMSKSSSNGAHSSCPENINIQYIGIHPTKFIKIHPRHEIAE